MSVLDRLRDLIQEDVGRRGLRADPERNLIDECPNDFAAACHSLGEHPAPSLVVVTGFFIPSAAPAAGETDGPLGALFLARALMPLGIRVAVATDPFCESALRAGLTAAAIDVPLVIVSPGEGDVDAAFLRSGGCTHLLAIERVGPSHTPESLAAQGLDFAAVRDELPPEHQGRCHTMRGIDVTDRMAPLHRWFEDRRPPGVTTIGIGDGGNEVGMGKIGWDVIRRNIPGGGRVACRTATDHLIVCGVSNWGAYALAAGVAHVRGERLPAALFDARGERSLLQTMVDAGPLVDGVLGKPSATVDGLTWDQYADVLVNVGRHAAAITHQPEA